MSDEDAIEMLAQQLITRPVFTALFKEAQFAAHNPVSHDINSVLDGLKACGLDAELDSLQKFYDSISQRIEGIDNADGKQKILMELYETFFSKAFPRTSARLGIVYTPIDAVKFIIRSADALIKREFGLPLGLGAAGVHILDPFTGTGTFIHQTIRYLADTCPDSLIAKYATELHANEMVLLAYYIATINIETTYHEHTTTATYTPFAGAVLTDTFLLDHKGQGKLRAILQANATRAEQQRSKAIKVIIGNPPYSAGQRNENDNNPNVRYDTLDARIKNTYVARTSVTNKNSLYDSYIRALRWATDRLGDEEGIIAYITNGGFIDSAAADGLRRCLSDDFSTLYILNLRGNARTQGEKRRQERGNVFGQQARVPVAIIFLIRRHGYQRQPATLYYHDIGDYLTRENKLQRLTAAGDLTGLDWQPLTPDAHGDWINQRDSRFAGYLPLGDKDNNLVTVIFSQYCSGIKTNRDAWTYNFARASVADNMQRLINTYNSELACTGGDHTRVTGDQTRIKWDSTLKQSLAKKQPGNFSEDCIRVGIYRPFTMQWLYFDRQFLSSVYRQPSFFPTAETVNRTIVTNGRGSNKLFSALMVDSAPSVDLLEKSQCFPRYTYPLKATSLHALGGRQDNIPTATVKRFQRQYSDDTLSGDDIFYYVYGVLHCPDYRTRYAADLRKTLARIPFARTKAQFIAFATAGRQLADLHTGYEQVAEYPLKEEWRGTESAAKCRVKRMRFRTRTDNSAIIYNEHLTLSGIPPAAHHYQVAGRSPLAWVIDRYCVKTDDKSGIINDCNAYCTDKNDARAIIRLIKRLVTVSVESDSIIRTLPTEWMED